MRDYYKGRYTDKNKYGQYEDNFEKKTKKGTGTRKTSYMKKKRSY